MTVCFKQEVKKGQVWNYSIGFVKRDLKDEESKKTKS